MMYRTLKLSLVLVLGAAMVGCKTKAGTGAVAGGAGGAAVGAIIGHQSGHAGGGALIGGAVGAIGGGLVGHGMDKKGEEKRKKEEEAAARQRDADSTRSTAYNDRETIGMGDVIDWTSRGVKEDVIVDRIERSNTVFKLTAADENHLRDAGVSERVIRAMKDTARK
jgi:hypothetical protein